MAKKSDDKAPGYDAIGYVGKSSFVLMTYRVAGLTDDEQRERAADWLWTTYKRGTDEQREQIGPRIEGGEVVYTFLTFLKDKETEGGKTAEVQTGIAKALNRPAKMVTVVMTHEPAPDAPPPLAGVDAPVVKELANAA